MTAAASTTSANSMRSKGANRFSDMLTHQPLTLVVISGLHTKATLSLKNRDLIYIGCDTHCDVILTDKGIAKRHCLISCIGGALSVTPLDAELVINGKKLSPSQSRHIAINDIIEIGNAAITLLHDDEHLDSAISKSHLKLVPSQIENNNTHNVSDKTETTSPRNLGRLTKPSIFITSFVLFGVALFLTTRFTPIPNFPQLSVANKNESHLTTHQTTSTPALIPTSIPEKKIETKSEANAMAENHLVLTEKTNPADLRIAQNVKEILRLSGINATTESLGNGTVKISGHFGFDNKHLESNGSDNKIATAIHSRAIQEIQGLRKIIKINLDVAAKPKPSVRTGKFLARTVRGADPYAISKDGSRYYIGSVLPGGATLDAIENETLIISTTTGSQRVSGEKALLIN